MTLVEKKFNQKSAVSDWMTANPTTILGDARLIQAYNLMKENGFRRLPVVKRNGELIGIITLSDIIQHVPFFPDDPEVEVDLPLMTMTVQEIMTWDPETIRPADTIQEAAELMLEAGVSGLPVMEHDRVVGIITESDIFRIVIESWLSE